MKQDPLKPKDVSELEQGQDTDVPNKSPYFLIQQFLRKNKGKAYKASQLQKLLNIADYWSVKYACKSLVTDGIIKAYRTNPTWYSWKGA